MTDDDNLDGLLEEFASDSLIPTDEEMTVVEEDMNTEEAIEEVEYSFSHNMPQQDKKGIKEHGLATLRNIIDVQKTYRFELRDAFHDADKIAERVAIDDTDHLLSHNRIYINQRTIVKAKYHETLNEYSDFVLEMEDALNPSKISEISKEYNKFSADDWINLKVGRVGKILNADKLEVDSRLVSAAGLAMLDYYKRQSVKTPYGPINLFSEADATKIATNLVKYIPSDKEIDYETIKDKVKEKAWKKIGSSYHSTMQKEHPEEQDALIDHIIGRLLISEVLEGKLVPDNAKDDNTKIYLKIGEAYSKSSE